MSDRFLRAPLTNANIANGTIEIYGFTLGANNLEKNSFIKTNDNGILVSTAITDTELTADLDCGGNDITNVGLVDSVDVSVLKSDFDTHEITTSGIHGVTGDIVGTIDIQTLTNKTIDGDLNTLSNIGNDEIIAGIDALKISSGVVDDTEFDYLNGVSSQVVGISDSNTLSNKTWGDTLDMDSNYIVNVLDPVNAQDVSTKAYTDALAAGLHVRKACTCITMTALDAYTQSGSGVGATLTANSNGVISDIDGYTPVNGDRILVSQDGVSTGSDSGIYDMTSIGDASNPWVMTRSSDMDNSPTSDEVESGVYSFILNGTQATHGFIITTTGTITVDTTTIEWSQFSSALQQAGAGLTATNTEINVIGSTNSIQVNANNIQVKSSSTSGEVLLSSGTEITEPSWGALDLANGNSITGILPNSNIPSTLNSKDLDEDCNIVQSHISSSIPIAGLYRIVVGGSLGADIIAVTSIPYDVTNAAADMSYMCFGTVGGGSGADKGGVEGVICKPHDSTAYEHTLTSTNVSNTHTYSLSDTGGFLTITATTNGSSNWTLRLNMIGGWAGI